MPSFDLWTDSPFDPYAAPESGRTRSRGGEVMPKANWFLVLSVIIPTTLAPATAGDQPAGHIRFEHVIVDRNTPEEVACKAVGDVDGDGFPDIIIGGYYKGGNLVWYQYPDWNKHVISTGQFAVDMQVGDVDGDADLDL